MLLVNLPPPEEGIKVQVSGVDLYVQRRCHGSGTLYVAESRLAWVKEGEDVGFSYQYQDIGIHAISRDTSSFPHECLYLMLNLKSGDDSHNGSMESDDEQDEEENSPITEIRCVPNDSSILPQLYTALNECQLLHPDPDDEFSDNEVGYFEEDPNEESGNQDNGDSMETDQFADA